MVLQNQEPLSVSDEQELLARWPRHMERVTAVKGRSACYVPLTTAHRRLVVLAFGSKQAGAYDTADVDFLQQVTNQVAVVVQNALAFEEIEALKDQLHQDKVYLEKVRAAHNLGNIFAAETDFTEPGELALFLDEEENGFLEDVMWDQGFLDTKQIGGAFQLLRSNDLIWSRLEREDLLGQRRPMTDLMAWNADGTRLPRRRVPMSCRKDSTQRAAK
jgi:hypothetical protein